MSFFFGPLSFEKKLRELEFWGRKFLEFFWSLSFFRLEFFENAHKKACLKDATTVDELRAYQQAVSDILDCKLKQFEAAAGGGLDYAKLLQKMAFYCSEGIRANSKIIRDFPDVQTRFAVEAEMALAKFYNRFFSPDAGQQTINSRKAIEHYDKAGFVLKRAKKLDMKTDTILF